jgi:hypothetical protein
MTFKEIKVHLLVFNIFYPFLPTFFSVKIFEVLTECWCKFVTYRKKIFSIDGYFLTFRQALQSFEVSESIFHIDIA